MRVGRAMASARPGLASVRPGAKVTALGCGALSILATTAACSTPSGTTGAGGSSPSVVSSGTAKQPTATPTASPSASPSPSPVQPTPFVSITPTATASPVPIGAPSTGGGGTAGVQDVLLFGIGGAALLAGAGSLVYRRRVMRDR
jgi:hypothetical protein